MIFQDAGSSLTPWLSVGEIVGERLRGKRLNRRERNERVIAALALVGLPAWSQESVRSSSRGASASGLRLLGPSLCRRAFCSAMSSTSALDASVAAGVLNLLGDLRRKLGMALLFVTHDLGVARLIAARIAVMYLGRIVEIGSADTILRAPIHPYTQSLIASIPRPGGAHAELAGEPPSLFDPPSGCAFHPRCPSARPSCAHRVPHLVSVGGGAHGVDCVLAEAD